MLHFVFWVNIVEVCYYFCVYFGFRCHPLRHSRSVVIFEVLTLPCRTHDVSMKLDIAQLLKICFGPRSHHIQIHRREQSSRGRNQSPYLQIVTILLVSLTSKRRNEEPSTNYGEIKKIIYIYIYKNVCMYIYIYTYIK